MPLPLCLGVCRSFFALAARFRRRASRRFTPPAAVSGSRSLAMPSPSGVARWSHTSVCSSWARGVVWLHVHARRDVLAQPPFPWPPNGRALVAAAWHGHLRPCACGVAHALDKGSGRPLASGMGRSARHTAVIGLPAPPSGPFFGGRKSDQKSRTGPFIGLYMHPKPHPAPLLVALGCREQQGVATCRTGPDMALHRGVFSK